MARATHLKGSIVPNANEKLGGKGKGRTVEVLSLL